LISKKLELYCVLYTIKNLKKKKADGETTCTPKVADWAAAL
jgi:hypothetical protein